MWFSFLCVGPINGPHAHETLVGVRTGLTRERDYETNVRDVLVPFMWTVTSDDRGDGNSAIKSHIPITNWYKLLCSSHKFPWYHLITPTYSQCIPLPKQAKPLGTVVVPNSSLAMEVHLNHPISSDFPWNKPSSYWYAPQKYGNPHILPGFQLFFSNGFKTQKPLPKYR